MSEDDKVVSLTERIKEMKKREDMQYAESMEWDDFIELTIDEQYTQLQEHADIICMLGTDLERVMDYSKKVETRLFDLEREYEEMRSILNKLLRVMRT